MHRYTYLYRIFQKNRTEGLQVRLSGGKKLSRRQTSAKQMPVLPVSKVPASRNGQRSSTYRLVERPSGQVTVQTKNLLWIITAKSACVANHITRPSSRRHESRFLNAGLLTGILNII